MSRFPFEWLNTKPATGIRFTCGCCGVDTAPANGYETASNSGYIGRVLVCTGCNRPTFLDMHGGSIRSTTPSAMMGNPVAGLPPDIAALYDEARSSTAATAYTAAVLICRKVLMHIAVEKKAKAGLTFVDYVDFLAQNGYVPPDGREWVDYIRTKSNEANHEIVVMAAQDADDLISFTEMLLRLVYEFKQRIPAPPKPP